MKRPDFLVVGAAKTGTTSLFHYLNQHPDIFIPQRKECRFFSQMPGNFIGGEAAAFQNDVIKTIDEYEMLFAGNELKIKGDISNDYLFYYKKSVRNIKKYLDNDVKIIIVLRNPVDRAYSNYLHSVRLGSENLSFEQAIIYEPYREKMNYAWPFLYIKTGMYYNQVKHYIDNFQNVKIILYDDLVKNDFLQKLFEFLDVSHFKIDVSKKYNISSIPKYNGLEKFIFTSPMAQKLKILIPSKINFFIKKWIIKFNSLNPQPLKPETKLYLQRIFCDDIRRLQALIHRDLSPWLLED